MTIYCSLVGSYRTRRGVKRVSFYAFLTLMSECFPIYCRLLRLGESIIASGKIEISLFE